MKPYLRLFCVAAMFSQAVAIAGDWPRFRGPAGSGAAADCGTLPDTWSPDSNLAWKTRLPGPGASSPIIVGEKVLVTCYSGYGLETKNPGQIENLVRHLVCVDLQTGKTLWQKNVKAALPEDPYDKSGVSSHGYASHTPVSDGINVYCFFGKGGVHAFDLHGKELWKAEAGKESDPPKWGSSSSPVIHNDTLIVTAAAESQSIIGFDKKTGRKRWRQFATGLDGMWGTPTLVKVDNSRTDLVMMVPGELWGLDPVTGKLRWYAKATSSQQAYTSVIARGNRVFACSGQGGGSVAVDAGGTGDTGTTHTVWTGPVTGTYASPVLHQSRLYIVSRGVLSVVDAKTGQRLQQLRLQGARKTGNARFGSLDYASPVVAGNRLFSLNASGQMFVFRLGEELQQLAVNEVTTAPEVFWGSPAISDGNLVLRSSGHLYGIADATSNNQPRHQTTMPEEDMNSRQTRDEPAVGPAGNRSIPVRSETQPGDTNQSLTPRAQRPQRPVAAED